ncbi:hypothetical protein EKE94_13875 [Mesobaculum littorinae]|uniref:Sulfotransferase family protein n=1 Tax=Mesobaculum littorinae TaxID=2486419 RepID=A0A438AFZ4_9RHOB|nr:hypothetical protein [Mesobaculum littorinae]RVV97614.1 hypothetical protein EKE94_13875 [Mesobaculum littorinae]
MKTVYCLGLHKTGSTSLQHYLLANQLKLARNGILFPPVHAHGTARFLAEALGRRPVNRRPARLNEYMGHNALAHRMIADAVPDSRFPSGHAPMERGDLVLNHVVDLTRQMQAHTLVFCSEDLATLGVRAPGAVDLFRERFADEGAGLFALVRRPDDALSSWQSQMLKFRTPFQSLAETGVGPWLRSVHVDYRAALMPWIERYPQAQRHILPYSDSRKKGGAVGVFKDAFPDIAVCAPRETADVNPSLPYAMIEIARLAMWRLPPLSATKLRSFLGKVAGRIDCPRNQDVDLIGAASRAELAAEFQDCEAWLQRISGRTPFFTDLDEIHRPRIFDGRSAAAEILPALVREAEAQDLPADIRDFLRDVHRRGPAD